VLTGGNVDTQNTIIELDETAKNNISVVKIELDETAMNNISVVKNVNKVYHFCMRLTNTRCLNVLGSVDN
jgi:hypothetical protein